MTDYSDLRPVLDYLERKTGLVFSTAHLLQVNRAVASAMDGKAKSSSEFIDLIDADRGMLDHLISQVTINETYFMRDSAHFDFITSKIIPQFLTSSEYSRNKKFKAWSAGCSTGEEAYSLAITLAQGMVSTTILASDIDAEALEKARLASYGEWSFRNTEPWLRSYFINSGGRSHLKTQIKERVNFFKFNLATDIYPSYARDLFELDLIMCRNVLIYFDAQTIERTARAMFASLAENGVLITGPSDPNLAAVAPFRLHVEDGISYYRKPARLAVSTTTTTKTGTSTGTNISRLSGSTASNISRKNSGTFSTSAKLPEANDAVARAEEAFRKGQYEKVCRLTVPFLNNEKALLLYLKSTANNTDSAAALKLLEARIHSYPLSTALHYLAALLYIDLHQVDNATTALTKTLYLTPSLAIAHFTMAFLLKGKGDLEGAKRALRNCVDMCSRIDKTAILELSDGEPAGRILEVAKRELASLEGRP